MNIFNIAVQIAESNFLNLSPHEFDQSANGWRKLVGFTDQAEAIINYLDTFAEGDKWNDSVPDGTTVRPGLLRWHAGQVLAFNNQYNEAISLMKESKDLTDPEWNEYVDATIAFLQNDRKKFIELTQKENYNKETLERLSRNFGKPYEVAYED